MSVKSIVVVSGVAREGVCVLTIRNFSSNHSRSEPYAIKLGSNCYWCWMELGLRLANLYNGNKVLSFYSSHARISRAPICFRWDWDTGCVFRSLNLHYIFWCLENESHKTLLWARPWLLSNSELLESLLWNPWSLRMNLLGS